MDPPRDEVVRDHNRIESLPPRLKTIVLDGRDLRDPVRVPTAAVAAPARGFLVALP